MKLRAVLFIAGGIAMVTLWYLVLIAPTHQTEAHLRSDLRTTLSQLEEFQATLNQLPVYLQTRDGINRQIAEVNARLFTRQELLLLFKHIERLAEGERLQVTELAPHIEELLQLAQSVPNRQPPQAMGLKLQLTGDYLAFGRFVEKLEAEAYFSSVDRCLVAESPDHDNKLLFTIEFKALLEITLRTT